MYRYAGDKYSGLSNLFTRNAKGWFIITDINDDNGFDEAEQWIKALRDKTTVNIYYYVFILYHVDN